MKHKLLKSTVCSSVLILTACGGSSDSSNQNTPSPNNPVSNLAYNKASETDLVTIPVVSLATSVENVAIETSNFAEEIHYNMTKNISTSCSSGNAQVNNNGSVTLNHCKDIKFGNNSYTDAKGLTFSGTIFSKITDTDHSEKYDVTLNNFSVKDEDGEISTYHGNIVQYFVHNGSNTDGQFDVNKLEITWTDGKESEKYSLSNYRLTEKFNKANSDTPATATGTLQGEVEGKTFAVNFTTSLGYNSQYVHDSSNVLNNVNINITDLTNAKNSIKISNATNDKALIQTTANGTTLTPRTVDWDYFD